MSDDQQTVTASNILIKVSASKTVLICIIYFQIRLLRWTNLAIGFFWAATAFIIMVWTFFRLPEVKGRTYEELDILFEDRVSARKFSKTHVDAYATVTPTEVPEKST